MQDMLASEFFGNSVLEYFIALGVFVFSMIVLLLFRRIILSRLKVWVEKTTTKIDNFVVGVLQRSLVPLSYIGAFYLSIQHLAIPEKVMRWVTIAAVVLLTIIAIRFLINLINFLLFAFWLRGEKNEARERSLKGVASVIKVVIWGLGIVFLLDNAGFKISSIIAGLGIGGIAVGIAAQAVLKDVFSFFAILFDRPFEIGDFIIIGDYLGSVEYIGMKTTRLRSLGGEQLIFSNSDLTDSRVRNYKRMFERRVVFKLGVTYQTPYVKMKNIPEIIKEIIGKVKDSRFDRAHFFSYGDFSLVLEVVYYVLSPDYNKYMDIQQEINFALMQEFEKRGIDFAYPTQTLYINKSEEGADAANKA